MKSSALAPSNADSRASSLGPSDSASQLTSSDFQKACDLLQERVESSSMRPSFLLPSVLWSYKDCLTDKSAGDIVTANNRNRPKMTIAIRHGDGSVISYPEYDNIRRSAGLLRSEEHT